MKKSVQTLRGLCALFLMMLCVPLSFAQKAGITDCWGTDNVADQGTFSTGYYYEFETVDETTVNVTFKLLDTDKSGAMAYAWTMNPTFSETGLTGIGDNTFTGSFTNQTPGGTFKIACKFAYPGGMCVTKYIEYIVGTSCEESTEAEISVSTTALSIEPNGTFTVSGYNLASDIYITTSSENFEVTPATLPSDAINQVVTVTYIGESFAEETATITLSSDGAESKEITVTGSLPDPEIVVSSSTLTINPSGSFTVSGLNLLQDITITCSSENFTVDPLTLPKDASYAEVNVTYNGAPGESEEATITLSSNQAADVVINVSASVSTPQIIVSSYAVTAAPTATFNVTGVSLSEQITLESSSENISVDPEILEANASDAVITVSYSGAEGTSETGSITLKSEGAEDVIVTVNAIKFGTELKIDDFEGDESTIGLWKIESAEFESGVIDNPYPEGINTSAKVFKGGRPAGSADWAGPILKPITFGSDRGATGATYIPAGIYQYMHVMMYRETDGGTINVKFNDFSGGDIAPTEESSSVITGKWQDLVFAVPQYTDIQFVFIMPGRGSLTEDLICYIDNVVFNNDPNPIMLEDNEAPTNFTAEVSKANIGSISFSLYAEDNEGIINYTIECSNGQSYKFTGESGKTMTATVNGLTPSTEYTFNISAADQQGNISENSPIEQKASTLDDYSNECEGVILWGEYTGNPIYKPEFEYSLTSIPEGDGYRVQLTVTFADAVPAGMNVSFGTQVAGVIGAQLVEGTTYTASWLNAGNVPFNEGEIAYWYAYFPFPGGLAEFPARTYIVGNCMGPQPVITASTDEVYFGPDDNAIFTVSSENLTEDIKISIENDIDFFILEPAEGTIEANSTDQTVEVMYIGAETEASTNLILSSEGARDVKIALNYGQSAPVNVEETDENTCTIWSANGGIYITVDESTAIQVFNLVGNMIVDETVTNGTSFFNADKGFYIVSYCGKAKKILVN